LLAFLGTSQEEGNEPRRRREEEPHANKETKNQMQFIKAKVVICMYAT
jgi:hypothetical protein